jgi:4-alpha-glucanotransferase
LQSTRDESNFAESPLGEAARLWGIEQRFWDIWGIEHIASPEIQKAILQSLGADASSDESLQRAIVERKRRDSDGPLPATLVISQGARTLPIAVPDDLADKAVLLMFQWESGDRAEFESRPAGGQWPLPPGLPLGYHHIELSINGQPSVSSRLIVCPDRAYQPEWLADGRTGGVALSLYGVRSDRNWGCGDFTDLENLVDWLAEDTGASFLALNPLHAIPNRQPYNTSPYLPNSIFYRNFIYLDLERIPDFASSERAQRLATSTRFQEQIASLRQAQFVEYERVSRLKLRFLKLLFRSFLANEYRRKSDRAREFQSYIDREGQLLHLYAVHSALDETLHKADCNVWNWRSWPQPYRDPDSPETIAFAKEHWRSVLFYKYAQWQLDIQLARVQVRARQHGLPIGLYHDLALATDNFGSDLWAHRPFYVSGCRVGSPPDNFSPKGQDWGFPPPKADQHFADGYQLFAQSIRKNSAHGGALRIDHVMRFFRLYWIPDGMQASQGTYVQDRFEDLLRILALESVRGEFIVIGEDLGTVPDIVREMLGRFGVLSYRLFYFEQDSSRRFKSPNEYPRQALVSASTHDLPTLAGFWQNRDIQARLDAGVIQRDAFQAMLAERAAEKQKMLDLLHRLELLPGWFPRDASTIAEMTGELHNAMIGFLCSTPCQLMVLNQEDLFKETEQQNLPGTTAEYPNWRRKMKYTVDELRGGLARPFTKMLREWLEHTGRLNRPTG